MNVIDKIHNCTLDRALREFIFKSEIEVKIFNYMIKEVNYLKKFSDVKKEVPEATRYYYKNVRNYIKQEIN